MSVDLGFDKDKLGGFINQVQDDLAAGATVWEATTHWRHGFHSEAHLRTHSLRSLLDLYGHSLDGMNRALSCRVRMQQRTIGRTDADPVRRTAVLRSTGRR